MADHTELPIIRLELEHMKHSVIAVLAKHNDEMQKAIEAELERQMQPENLMKLIRRETELELSNAVRASMQNFFRFGAGRDFVYDLVDKVMNPDKVGNTQSNEEAN